VRVDHHLAAAECTRDDVFSGRGVGGVALWCHCWLAQQCSAELPLQHEPG
jgi:hypothetical protein